MDKTAQVIDSVGAQVLKAMLVELQMLSPRYQSMAQDKQQEVIDRLRDALADSINHAVHVIAAKSYDSLPVKIIKAQLKEGIQFQVNCVGTPLKRMGGRGGQRGHAGVLRSRRLSARSRLVQGTIEAARRVWRH